MSDEQQHLMVRLDAARHHSSAGDEYWMGREIQTILGYSNWQNFENVVRKAEIGCVTAGVAPDYHFIDTNKLIEAGKGARLEKADFFLSRYACYLIAMNGDPAKPEIGFAQTYFAVQTRRMEVEDQRVQDQRRLELRDRTKRANKSLSVAAQASGVQRFALFHDAGYRGLYGLSLADLKRRKGIQDKENLLDRAGLPELAANAFRMTQTEEKLKRESISGEQRAIDTHRTVGKVVRDAIREIGGTLPEDIPPEPPIQEIQRRLAPKKKLPPKKGTD